MSKIYCLDCNENYVVSGSMDNTIRVWHIASGRLEYVLEGHRSLVALLQIEGVRKGYIFDQ